MSDATTADGRSAPQTREASVSKDQGAPQTREAPGWVAHALERALDSVAQRLDTDGYPHVTENGSWVLSKDGFWTGGFWIGLEWAGYEERGDQRFRAAAERLLATFIARANENPNHDLGMMFGPSAVKGFELTGEPRYRDAALLAAETLAAQLNPRGSYIPGWGFFGQAGWEGVALVDTLMSLRLLFWASEQSGNPRFREVALAHARTSLAYHLRADGSTYHAYRFDPETGAPLRGDTYQGKSAEGCWSRGLAWLIAGCAQLATCTQPADGTRSAGGTQPADGTRSVGGTQPADGTQPAGSAATVAAGAATGAMFREAAERGADYYLAHLPNDLIPYWDFSAAADEPRDASAGAIAAYGLALLGKPEALSCLKALVEHAQAPAGHAAILLHATADLPHGIGIDESTIYGDYYFVRALQQIRELPGVRTGARVLELD